MTVLKWLLGRIEAQPVAFGTLVRGGLLIGMAFGLKLTMTQLGLIYPWIEGVIAFLTGNAVTPNPTVQAQVTAALNTPVPNPNPQ